MCVMECHDNYDSFFVRHGLALVSIKEKFLFSINVFKSNHNNKKRYDEQNTPRSESYLKTLGSGLEAYLKVLICMSSTFMKASREDKKLFFFSSQFHVFILRRVKTGIVYLIKKPNTIDFMASLHCLDVHGSMTLCQGQHIKMTI